MKDFMFTRGPFVLRPITLDDRDDILSLAFSAMAGITSLPKNKRKIDKRISKAVASFKDPDPDKPQSFLFGLEDLASNHLIGLTGLHTNKGMDDPDMSFHQYTKHMKSSKHKLTKRMHTLELHTNTNHPTEIGSLYLDSEYRGFGLGKWLSVIRFQILALFPDLFSETIMAEFRGVSDADGVSPFWSAVGRNCVDVSFEKVVDISADHKGFLADYLPVIILCAEFLPPDARKVIGQVHPNTRPAYNMLINQGFTQIAQVDLYDGGPRVAAARDQIIAVQKTQRAKVLHVKPVTDGKLVLMSNATLDKFKATAAWCKQTAKGVTIPPSVAKVLKVKQGDEVALTDAGLSGEVP